MLKNFHGNSEHVMDVWMKDEIQVNEPLLL